MSIVWQGLSFGFKFKSTLLAYPTHTHTYNGGHIMYVWYGIREHINVLPYKIHNILIVDLRSINKQWQSKAVDWMKLSAYRLGFGCQLPLLLLPHSNYIKCIVLYKWRLFNLQIIFPNLIGQCSAGCCYQYINSNLIDEFFCYEFFFVSLIWMEEVLVINAKNCDNHIKWHKWKSWNNIELFSSTYKSIYQFGRAHQFLV